MLEFEPAAVLPVSAILLPSIFAIFAVLDLLGIEPPGPRGAQLLVPFLATFGAMFAAARVTGERAITIAAHGGRATLYWESGREFAELPLDELATVARETRAEGHSLTLTDLRGTTLTIPLGVWTDEERLLAEVSDGATRAGAMGVVGDPVPVRRPPWILPVRICLFALFMAAVSVIVFTDRGRKITVEPVTKPNVRDTAGVTADPFADRSVCDVYVVPLDRPSEATSTDLASRLGTRVPVHVCSTRSLALDQRVVDDGRRQADVSAILLRLADRFRAAQGARPSTILGVTHLDLFWPDRPEWRFVFGVRRSIGVTQGYGALSSARMGGGADRLRRLETMAMRYVGFLYYGLSQSPDPASALYHTVLSLDELDPMRPQFSDPSPTSDQLRVARVRFLNAAR